jgi:hypothetical protein
MATITLEQGQFGSDYIIRSSDGETMLVQTDWEYPGIATTFGWDTFDVQHDDDVTLCKHIETDGTVDCPDCGMKTSKFIAAAHDYLDEHIGDEVDDPGYFE